MLRGNSMLLRLKDSTQRYPSTYTQQVSPLKAQTNLPLVLKTRYPVGPSMANWVSRWTTALWKYRPVKWLARYIPRNGGRNCTGRVTVRGRGGGARCLTMAVNYQYPHPEMPKRILTYEYNRRRSAWLSLVYYSNGVLAYHPLVDGLAKDTVTYFQGTGLVPKLGEWRQLKDVPAGTLICNVENWPGGGGCVARAAGTSCMVMKASEEQQRLHLVPVMFPSRAIRLSSEACWCTVGSISNPEHKYENYGKAGRRRNLGRKPVVRGIAMNACDHPHGSKKGTKSGKGKKGVPRSIYGWQCKSGFRLRPEHKPAYKFVIREARHVRHARYTGGIETNQVTQDPDSVKRFRKKFSRELQLLGE